LGSPRIIVLDTNVLVSALGWLGPEHEIYQLCRERQLQAATSPELLEELQRVLHYPKFGLAEEEVECFVAS
jgi:putative PIN family toxin of toxin-antitoxin system